ncbi:hypothetical protein [Paracoccus denitrificans]|jgi:hypothetical protein|uniref:Uncharacterized protein n=1 Tax=Paracoccus denitrificans (strain Pd 1222) TaxID=318586 RepID=A1AYZ9_PARDP|nr:hypothetical protein [Paracoccus denitrificans]RQP04839.1 MAG: hypothetical protein D1H97_16090 [Paracoccus sp. BP8]ABL68493.1 hypothetical protein Pden_0379 [Paracoccus denitrificans PD1222]MBB4625786.1 hypothetical protein [Paracoccus denitrificans]MCU7427049.1 hypothetical protein [Paracoccus denitrificans]QAR26568.1 hypothetical protein EO213_09810 [Paracoccus denitrificans]
MTDPGPFRSADFWIAVGVALIVKIKTSASLGPVKVITSMIVAAGAAWVASDYAAETFGVPLPIAAAVVTLTAEGAMRWLLIAVNDPKQAIDLWRYWRR